MILHEAAIPRIDTWGQYYDSSVRPFSGQIEAYKSSIKQRALVDYTVLSPSIQKTFVLAGFHSTNGTPQDFKRFCQTMHNNTQDRHIFLDMNKQPLSELAETNGGHRIQAVLEQLPFTNASIDFLFADFTTDFMNDQQVKGLSSSGARILTKNGLMLVAGNYPEDLKLLQITHPKFSFFPRSVVDFQRLMSDVKLVGRSAEHDADILTFARKDSVYPERKLLNTELLTYSKI